jgi:hypothetical protein
MVVSAFAFLYMYGVVFTIFYRNHHIGLCTNFATGRYFCNGQGCPQSVNAECNGAVWPNPSFIEWPGIEARVIFWLSALHAIPGMLYFADGYWASQVACDHQTLLLPEAVLNVATHFPSQPWY